MAPDQAEKGKKASEAVTAFDPVSAALQQLHQAVASEDLPPDFLRLLDEIDAKLAAVSLSETAPKQTEQAEQAE